MKPTVKHPKISVVIPVFNGEKYLEEAIESLQRQTFEDFEIIVVDDGSNDKTPSLLEALALKDERIHIVRTEHGGIVKALNAGIECSKSEFVARMDVDDVSFPNRLRQQYEYMVENPDCTALGAKVVMVDPKGRKLCDVNPPPDHDAIVERLKAGDGTAIIHPVAFFRKKDLLRVGCYDNAYRHVEDYELYIRLSKIGKLANLSEVLLSYRQHPASVNNRYAQIQNQLKKEVIQKYFQLEDTEFGSPNSFGLGELYYRWAYFASTGGTKTTTLRYLLKFLVHSRPASWKKCTLILRNLFAGK